MQLNNLQTNTKNNNDQLIFEVLFSDIINYFSDFGPDTDSSDLWTKRMNKTKKLFLKNNKLNKDFFLEILGALEKD